MKVITAPQDYIPQPNDVLCFLAGGITNCKEWQEEVIFTLKRIGGLEHLVVFNPRRDNFPIDDPNASEEQITWEFNWLNRADIFSMYFCRSESDQPICMYELGRNLHKMKTDYPISYEDRIVVSVEDGYKRESDVKIQMMLAVSLKASTNTNPIYHAYEIAGCYRNLTNRKTESNSEVPHSCMTCKHKDKADNDFPCVKCFYDDTMYEPQTDYSNYERAIEQIQYDMLYESTYNVEDGSM